MGLSNLGEQVALNRLFAADQTPTVGGVQEDLGPVAGTAVKYFIHLHQTGTANAPSEWDMGTAYPGTNYVAKECVFSKLTESVGTADTVTTISLNTTVEFTASAANNWPVITYYSIHACATAGAAASANMIFSGTFATPATVGTGDTVQIVAGSTGLAITAA